MELKNLFHEIENKGLKPIIITAMICFTVLFWGIFIWPTPYKYEKISRPWYSGTKQEVYRITRFTGYAKK